MYEIFIEFLWKCCKRKLLTVAVILIEFEVHYVYHVSINVCM